MLVAILRYRLWGIDLIINRTLVYGTLSLGVVALYAVTVNALAALARGQGGPGLSLLATGLVAVLFEPFRRRLQRSVNRLMYGERDEPYAVLSHLGERLEGTLTADVVLGTIVETVTKALKLPYAAIALQRDGTMPVLAAHGAPIGEVRTVPLVHEQDTVGQLQVTPRVGERSFSQADQRLLDDLARQSGVALHAVQLAADLQHSREQLVTLQEEERRRLRRDLHDGLGPALASVMLKINAARRTLGPQSLVETELVEARTGIQEAIADIRRLVYALRPPALDDLGLPGAIRQRAAEYDSENLHVLVDAPEQLPPLPAAVEVAVYRIVQEALTNVERHAHAHTCRIRLALSDSLKLEVTDDGAGLLPERRAGVGLTSMHERAAELGGTCVIEAAPTGGTQVCVNFPLPRA